MKAQFIFMNQCHQRYIQPWVDHLVFSISTTAPSSTVAPDGLRFHVLSKVYEYAILKNFANECERSGYSINRYEDCSYSQAVTNFLDSYDCDVLYVMQPAETYQQWLVQSRKKKWQWLIDVLPNTQFLVDHVTFEEKFEKPPVMETFYRWMRRATWILMDWSQPIGGQWNFDKDNRKFDRHFTPPERYSFSESDWWTQACQKYKQDLLAHGIEGAPVQDYAVTTQQADQYLDRFIDNLLDRFWELEDAMYAESDTVHHSLVSVPLNFGLLDPLDVIKKVEQADTAINNKEWFIRQVLGRREYMYHWFLSYKDTVYWSNYFDHIRELPNWFWRPKESPLKMTCVNHVLKKVHRIWYAHHIERLMIIGNFCLLVWYSPRDVTRWFREWFLDAFERVVTPNVMWMSQYADGWMLATKPYVASANYVNKMSNYCKSCRYNPKEKYGEDACPLNYLYWNFLYNNQSTFQNARQSFILNHLKKLDIDRIKQQSQDFIDSIT